MFIRRNNIIRCFVMFFVGMIFFTGCAGEITSETSTENFEQTNMYNLLSEQQLDYLKTYYEFTEDHFEEMINLMSYETINTALQGTGFELYNKTSGVEVNGVTYKYDENVNTSLYGKYYASFKSTSDKKITIEEIYEIRKKDELMRLEDFLNYHYTIEPKDDNSSQFFMEIDGLEEVYVCIDIEESVDGVINMSVPYFVHKGIENVEFSMLYDKQAFEAYIYEEPYYSSVGKLISYIKYNTITNQSFVFAIKNITDKEIIVNQSYSIWKLVEDNYVKVKEIKRDDEEKLQSYKMWDIPIKYTEKGEELEKGKYLLKFGKNNEGYVYNEIEFEIN